MYFSIVFYPQTDDESEITIQTLEDMFRICVLQFKGSWDEPIIMVTIPALGRVLVRHYMDDVGRK